MSFSSSARCTEAYLKPRQISKMGRFAKIVNDYKKLAIFAKRFSLYISRGPGYAYTYHT